MAKYLFPILLLATSCSHKTPVPEKRDKVDRILIRELGPLHQESAGEVSLGGLSDLVFSVGESTANVKVFYAITDRGPNKKTLGSKTQPKRPFLFPDFTPQIIKLEYQVQTREARVTEHKALKNPDGSASRGLPNIATFRKGAALEEAPVDRNGTAIRLDPWGLDPEGLAIDDQGNFWIAEEYGPSVAKVAADGRVLKRWYPQRADISRGGKPELPAFLSTRTLNRGFEAAVWLPGGKLLLFMQSELPVSADKKWAPVLEFDTLNETTTAVYFYPLSIEGGKIGGASADATGKVFLLEQNGEVGDRAWQRVFELDFKKATNVLAETRLGGLNYSLSAKTVPILKNEIINLTVLGLQNFEKLEGLSLLSESEMYILNDNDFNVEGKTDESSESYLFRLIRN